MANYLIDDDGRTWMPAVRLSMMENEDSQLFGWSLYLMMDSQLSVVKMNVNDVLL
jgi:hypothetical protein